MFKFYRNFLSCGFSHIRLEHIVWILGYWQFEWAAEYVRISNNSTAKTFSIQSPYNYTGSRSTELPIRAFNVYEELDEPGEWYIDRINKKLYVYPIDGTTQDSVITMTSLADDFIQMTNTEYVTIKGFDMTGGRNYAINIEGGQGNTIDGCTIHLFEKTMVRISGESSKNNGIKNSVLYDAGAGAIELNGGDTDKLIPAGNYVYNNYVSTVALMKEVYSPAVGMSGVGNLISHNDFEDGPHQVISFRGVDNVMEYNSFHNVCRNAADMGVIYSGRKLSDQDNIVRYNHFYNIGDSKTASFYSVCFFTDDGSSGSWVYGNVCGPQITNSQAFKVHGGMNNHFFNNVIIDGPRVYYQNTWTKQRWYDSVFGTALSSLKTTADYAFARENYLTRWPYLNDLKNTKSGDANNIPYADKYPNEVANNVVFYIDQAPHPTNQYQVNSFPPSGGKSANLEFINNPTLHKSYFKDWNGGNYGLTEEAYQEIWKTLPNFEKIPFDAIGRVVVAKSKPIASNVSISPDLAFQGILIGGYAYRDDDRDLEGNSIYRWYVADTDAADKYTLIAGVDRVVLCRVGKSDIICIGMDQCQ